MFAPPSELTVRRPCCCVMKPQYLSSPAQTCCEQWPDVKSVSEIFMAVSPQELAEQLTLIDFAIYSNIEVPPPAHHARTHTHMRC